MKMVDNMRCQIMDEARSAMDYAEKYVEYKTTKPAWANMYMEMAKQELTHADHLNTIAVEAMSTVAYIPEEDKEKFEKCQRKANELSGVVKFMLSK